jgi:hypothetical protein
MVLNSLFNYQFGSLPQIETKLYCVGGYLQTCGEQQQRLGMAYREFMTNVIEKVLTPLKKFITEDMKTIQKERQKLGVKRLDLDVCKNRARRATTFEKQQLVLLVFLSCFRWQDIPWLCCRQKVS